MAAARTSWVVAVCLWLVGGGITSLAAAQPSPVSTFNLGGPWEMLLDPAARGLDGDWASVLSAEQSIPTGPDTTPHELLFVDVPGAIEQREESLFYDGMVWLRRRFGVAEPLEGARVALRFERVNYLCRVWLDGAYLGEHEGGYEPFELEATGQLGAGPAHTLVVMVVDPGSIRTLDLTLKTTPHAKESWYVNHGGILGEVELEIWRAPEVIELDVRPDEASVRLDGGGVGAVPPGVGEVPVRVDVTGPGRAPRHATTTVTPRGSRAAFSFAVDGETPLRWSPEQPHLYTVRVQAGEGRPAERRVGFRRVSVVDGDLLIDGRARVLHGVLYQPHHVGLDGRDPPPQVQRAEVERMLAAGFDLVRAHVRPPPPAFLDAADELGLLVLCEPAIGWVDDDPALGARLEREVRSMVERLGHHPSIIAWGILNEASGKGYRYGHDLARLASTLDPTRPVLVDSGGFLGGGELVTPGGAADPFTPMLDSHQYPPFPLPYERRAELRTIGDPARLAFVSEYGYGTLVDGETAAAGFRERGLRTAERAQFESFAATARRSREEAWGDWTAAAARLQAQAAVDMTEALRSNPALDLICYTQWQAVSNESSAGLLSPWGAARPAFDALGHALQPLMICAWPERPSVREGETIRYEIAIVDDRAEPGPTRATLVVDPAWAAPVEQPVRFERGVTTAVVELPAGAPVGRGAVEVALVDADGTRLDVATPHEVAVVAAPPADRGISVLVPNGDERAVAALRREGFTVRAGADADALPLGDTVVITRPEQFGAEAPVERRLRVWEHVRLGGGVVVLLDDPAASRFDRALGMGRGFATLTAFPRVLTVASAPGNFMGRVFPFRTDVFGETLVAGGDDAAPSGDEVRLLGRGDEVLSPVAILTSPLPPGAEESMIAVGHLGTRRGAVVADVPFGRGTFTFVGLPLLEPVAGAADPRRDALLARLVERAVREVAVADSAMPALGSSGTAAWSVGESIVAEVVRNADRYSPLAGGRGHPAPILDVLEGRNAAVLALLEGRKGDATRRLTESIAPVWSEEVRAYLALEQVVLDLIRRLIETGDLADWDLAYDALDDYARGLSFWFQGDGPTALDWFGRAELLIREAKGWSVRREGASTGERAGN